MTNTLRPDRPGGPHFSSASPALIHHGGRHSRSFFSMLSLPPTLFAQYNAIAVDNRFVASKIHVQQLSRTEGHRYSNMTESPQPEKFKPEMPHIPGIAGSPRFKRKNPLMPLIIGLVLLSFVLLLFAARWLSRPRTEPPHTETVPQMEVPSAPPDPMAALPRASANRPVIAHIADLSKPWSSLNFFIQESTTGANQLATIIRLPTGSASQPAGYWAFSLKAPYGGCQLEYVTDMDKIRKEYGYPHPTHALAGNPCTHTLYDPLKTANLPGNTWIRGAIVQGSDLRPPLGVEIQIHGKDILAIRTE